MELRSSARADTAVNTIMWFAGIIAVLIIVVWFVSNNPYSVTKKLDIISKDLLKLKQLLGNACNINTYESRYNPETERGVIEFQNNELCITIIGTSPSNAQNLTKCTTLYCEVQSASLDLDKLTFLLIKKDGEITVEEIE